VVEAFAVERETLGWVNPRGRIDIYILYIYIYIYIYM